MNTVLFHDKSKKKKKSIESVPHFSYNFYIILLECNSSLFFFPRGCLSKLICLELPIDQGSFIFPFKLLLSTIGEVIFGDSKLSKSLITGTGRSKIISKIPSSLDCTLSRV